MKRASILPLTCLPAGVGAAVTTRVGGASQGVYSGLNLGAHVGDELQSVEQNRAMLHDILGPVSKPVWLEQVHGDDMVEVISPNAVDESPAVADAAFTLYSGIPLAVMAADCLPILIASLDAEVIAVIHAGWRGLAAGIIGKSLERLPQNRDYMAYVGPAIGVCHYEVDLPVRQAFSTGRSFFKVPELDRWMFDLAKEAEFQLEEAGVVRIEQAVTCTSCDERFYSFRRNGITGRFAALIWIQP